MKTKKAFPILLSFLAIASIASTAVLGNTQTVYAGDGCSVDPNMLDFGVISSDVFVGALKTITCSGDVTDVVIDTSDCDVNGISVFFLIPGIVESGVWTGDELIGIGSFAGPLERSCDVKFTVTHLFGEDILFQSISLIRGEFIGGEFLPIDSTALMLAGLQSSAIWMIPTLAGVAGSAFGILYIKSRRN